MTMLVGWHEGHRVGLKHLASTVSKGYLFVGRSVEGPASPGVIFEKYGPVKQKPTVVVVVVESGSSSSSSSSSRLLATVGGDGGI